jgi:hypothetical protein
VGGRGCGVCSPEKLGNRVFESWVLS